MARDACQCLLTNAASSVVLVHGKHRYVATYRRILADKLADNSTNTTVNIQCLTINKQTTYLII